MANWTALSFGYGTKLTSTQMTQLFDNISAAFEGASGSPGGYVTAGTSYQLAFHDSCLCNSYGSYQRMVKFQIPVLVAGQLRIAFTLYSWSSAAAYARIYRNGTAVGSERSVTSSGYSTTFTENISSWAPGDELAIYGKGGGRSLLGTLVSAAAPGACLVGVNSTWAA